MGALRRPEPRHSKCRSQPRLAGGVAEFVTILREFNPGVSTEYVNQYVDVKKTRGSIVDMHNNKRS